MTLRIPSPHAVAHTAADNGAGNGAGNGADNGADNGAERTGGPPDVDNVLFRRLMGSLVSGVSILTTISPDGTPCGMTCSAVCSVSADPPLLLACIGMPSSTLTAIRARGSFAVNFLDAESYEVSGLFASRVPDKFARVQWRPGAVTGMPVLAGTVARTECAVHQDMVAGDHAIVIGRIVGGEAEPEGAALGYWRGEYLSSAQSMPRR